MRLQTETTDEQNTRRGLAVYIQNPFMKNEEVKAKARRVTNKRGDMMLISAETGEIQSPVAGFWEAKEVDSTQFVKLYVNGVKALSELTNAGTKVFELLYMEMQRNIGKDQVFLSYGKIEGNQISRAVFWRGIAELIEKKFIAAGRDANWYWINPDFVWNGDRLAFVKEYRRVEFSDLTQRLTNKQKARPLTEMEQLEVAGQGRLFD